jgi:hypothetical protein
MLALVAACALTLQPLFEDAAQKPPSAELVQKTVAKLEQAFTKGSTAERIAAIDESAPVVDPKVIDWIAKGLKSDDAPLRGAAIDALGAMRHDDALKALEETWKRDRDLRKDDALSGRALKAIARHQNPRSIALLSSDPFESQNHGALEARILGLANIRAKESVEALIAMMRLVGPVKIEPYMGEFRLALYELTGTDQGKAPAMWFDWWNDHKKDLAISKEPPELAKPDQAHWNAYWGIESTKDKVRERAERDQKKKKDGEKPPF